MAKWVEKWDAISSSSGKSYVVSRSEDMQWGCSCPHWTNRHTDCKHIKGIRDAVLSGRPLPSGSSHKWLEAGAIALGSGASGTPAPVVTPRRLGPEKTVKPPEKPTESSETESFLERIKRDAPWGF